MQVWVDIFINVFRFIQFLQCLQMPTTPVALQFSLTMQNNNSNNYEVMKHTWHYGIAITLYNEWWLLIKPPQTFIEIPTNPVSLNTAAMQYCYSVKADTNKPTQELF